MQTDRKNTRRGESIERAITQPRVRDYCRSNKKGEMGKRAKGEMGRKKKEERMSPSFVLSLFPISPFPLFPIFRPLVGVYATPLPARKHSRPASPGLLRRVGQ